MVVLRAEREEGWLILGYVTPPTLNCSTHAARLEMGKQSLLGKVCFVWIQMCEGRGRGVCVCVWGLTEGVRAFGARQKPAGKLNSSTSSIMHQ